MTCGARPKGTASARLLVEILGVEEGMGKPPKERIEMTFLSVIELCRDDDAAPMNKSTVFLVDKDGE